MTIDSRDRFKKGIHAKAWSDITASEAFAEAVSATMLTMLASQTNDAPAANSYRLEGARQFASILSNLTSTFSPPKTSDQQNLKTNV